MAEDHPRAARPARLTAIEDADDPRLADYRGLTDVRLRTTWEPPHGVFIAESELVIRRALEAGYRPRSMVMAPEWLDRMAPLIADVDAPVYSAPYDVLRRLTGFHVHRGALASFHRRPLPTAREVAALPDRQMELAPVPVLPCNKATPLTILPAPSRRGVPIVR